MITVTRRLEFDAAHRVLGHEGKCKNLHGHRYVAEIKVWANGLDTLGRVIDFSVIKEKVGKWIDERWDHNVLLNSSDPIAHHISMLENEDKSPYLFMSKNPTAENIAKELYEVASHILKSDIIQIKRVRIYETPNCWADYIPEKTGGA